MNRLCTLIAIGAALGLCTAAAHALIMAPPPGPVRIALTDTLLVGRIVGHEPKDVELAPFPGADKKVPHRIAVVKVSEVIKGKKDEKSVRIAFVPPKKGGPIVSTPPVKLDEGVEGMFYLARHHASSDLFVVGTYLDVVPAAQNENYEKEVKAARAAMKLLADPIAALKSDKAGDRMMAAAVLIHQYRNQRSPKAKTEEIPAEESKLILKVLREADWKREAEFGMGPFELFMQLGLTQKDGWKNMDNVDINQIRTAAQEWLAKNADTYRIRRFVTEKR